MLIDEVRHERPDLSLMEVLNRAFVVDAQNVSEYLFSSGKTTWSYSDFPNVAPPFPDIWFEYHVKANDGPFPGRHYIGCMVSSVDLTQEEPEARRKALAFFGMTPLESEVLSNPELSGRYRWVVRSTLFKRVVGDKIIEMGSMWIIVREDGSIADPKRNIRYTPTDAAIALAKKLDLRPDDLKDAIKGANFPVLLALTFMHCRNVSTVKKEPIGEALQKSRVSKGKPRLTRAHVIMIDPMRKAIKDGTGQDGYSRGPQVIHIVRGHFRTYSDRPLFGKYKGTFWVPMHTAGTEGFAAKNSYEVKPSGDSSQS